MTISAGHCEADSTLTCSGEVRLTIAFGPDGRGEPIPGTEER